MATHANITPEHNMFKPYAGDYASNMTLTAVVELNGHELRQEGYFFYTNHSEPYFKNSLAKAFTALASIGSKMISAGSRSKRNCM